MSTPEVGTINYQYSHTIGIDDSAGRSFRCAVDLALGPEGLLFVLQRGMSLQKNLAVKICSVDEEFFGDFGTYGTGPGQWVWPAGIAADSQQRLYVSDEWNQRITVFDKQGNLLDEWGEAGAAEGQLNRPSGLAFDAEEHLLLVDAYAPGWLAYLDGVETSIYPADVAMRAVAVPEGVHEVVFRYSPLWWSLGLPLAGLGVLLGIGWICLRVPRRRPTRAIPRPGQQQREPPPAPTPKKAPAAAAAIRGNDAPPFAR